MMSLAAFEKLLSDIKAFPEQVKVLYFSAGFGEPLLNKSIVRMVDAAAEAQVCRDIRLITNGSLLTHGLSRGLVDAGLNVLRVSVEAIDDEGYLRVTGRRLTGGYQGFFDEIKYAYQYSRGTRCQIAVRLFINTLANESAVDRACSVWSKISDDCLVVQAENIWPEFTFANSVDYVGSDKVTYHTVREARGICNLPFTTMNIHANGDASACCADWKYQLVYGNVANESLKALWQSPALRHLWLRSLEGRHSLPFCASCQRTPDDVIRSECADAIKDRILGENTRAG
jgi:MoaA/NifB/PqqE/SkfB family radical SAM enzyme